MPYLTSILNCLLWFHAMDNTYPPLSYLREGEFCTYSVRVVVHCSYIHSLQCAHELLPGPCNQISLKKLEEDAKRKDEARVRERERKRQVSP